MQPVDFRRIALNMPGALESAHMHHPDFRAGGRIFATLDYPENGYGVVMLTPQEQREFVRRQPAAFAPVKGAWGRNGSTQVRLDAIDAPTLESAIRAAWSNKAATTTQRRRDASNRSRSAAAARKRR